MLLVGGHILEETIRSESMDNEIRENIESIIIERHKTVDNMIAGEILKIASENGIDTKIILNEKAIVEALKKQIPRNPLCISGDYDAPICPECKQLVDDTEHYCSTCGQALDWSDAK